jgi:chromosomal replication initiator protein
LIFVFYHPHLLPITDHNLDLKLLQHNTWEVCISLLKEKLSVDDISRWIMPLHGQKHSERLKLLAPNRYVLDFVKQNFFEIIENVALSSDQGIKFVDFEIGSYGNDSIKVTSQAPILMDARPSLPSIETTLNPDFTFDKHVEGRSNQLARAAAMHVSMGVDKNSYNPLFIYGGVGLGKTHLMHAAGIQILEQTPTARVVYVRSEIFVNDFVQALKNKTMSQFKSYYRSLDALLIDDIQFLARKDYSQEEFFHTFNTLIESNSQIIMTSDRIPKAISDVDDRLRSRFSSGLTVSIEPPELETRVAILVKKANDSGIELSDEVAFFVANIIRSNVRELEGGLHRIHASARFTGRNITIDLAREALRDLLMFQQKQITLDNIQQRVAEYFKMRVSDLLSRKRSRDIVRPRQLAMAFAKQLTDHSLPQIGDKFGGRDHTTVLHACRKIEELIKIDSKVAEDYENLRRLFGE